MPGDEHAELGPGVPSHVEHEDLPINRPSVDEATDRGITRSGASGHGPTEAPEPIAVREFKSGKYPSVTYVYVVGSDGKIYGKGDQARIPRGPRRRVTFTFEFFKGEAHVTAEITHRVRLTDEETGNILAEAKGKHEEAARLYAEAADRWEGFGVVPERAFALLGLGRSLIALGRTADAAPLQKARVIFSDLGARPALAETVALLERTTALAS